MSGGNISGGHPVEPMLFKVATLLSKGRAVQSGAL